MSGHESAQRLRPSWADREVLVTGAGGFIGSHLVERLAALGARTRALVHYRSDGRRGCLDELPCAEDVEVVAGDVRDPGSMAHAMRGIEVVFHLAALIGIPYSYHAPSSYVRTNVEGTLNVLQVARAADIERFVHTSTSEVYGSARQVPISEEHPLQAQSPYAASKIAADKLVEAFVCSFGLPAVTVRPFNTFGPRQSARAVIPTIMVQCLTGAKVRLGNLAPTRDLNFVENIVDGFVRAAEAPEAIGRTFNLGSGREIRIGELAQLIGELARRPVEIEQEPARVRPEASEVDRLVADNTAARMLLGWEPAVSLEDGLRRTLSWMEEHLDGYRPAAYAL